MHPFVMVLAGLGLAQAGACAMLLATPVLVRWSRQRGTPASPGAAAALLFLPGLAAGAAFLAFGIPALSAAAGLGALAGALSSAGLMLADREGEPAPEVVARPAGHGCADGYHQRRVGDR